MVVVVVVVVVVGLQPLASLDCLLLGQSVLCKIFEDELRGSCGRVGDASHSSSATGCGDTLHKISHLSY